MNKKHDLKVVSSSNTNLLEAIKKLFDENEFLLLELDFSLASSVKYQGEILISVILIKSKHNPKRSCIHGFVTTESGTQSLISGDLLFVNFKAEFETEKKTLKEFLESIGELIREIHER